MSRRYQGKTDERIEASLERSLNKGEEGSREYLDLGPPVAHYKRGQHPNSHVASGERNGKGKVAASQAQRLRLMGWKKGQSGNPRGGQVWHDTSRQIARAIFENNEEAIYKAYGKAVLKGNAYAFQVLADRAYGKLKERREVEVTRYSEATDQTIVERIAELEAKLGYREPATLAGRISQLEGGALEAKIPPED